MYACENAIWSPSYVANGYHGNKDAKIVNLPNNKSVRKTSYLVVSLLP